MPVRAPTCANLEQVDVVEDTLRRLPLRIVAATNKSRALRGSWALVGAYPSVGVEILQFPLVSASGED
jgi:hypothetical protein